jgi:hypothetical protein
MLARVTRAGFKSSNFMKKRIVLILAFCVLAMLSFSLSASAQGIGVRSGSGLATNLTVYSTLTIRQGSVVNTYFASGVFMSSNTAPPFNWELRNTNGTTTFGTNNVTKSTYTIRGDITLPQVNGGTIVAQTGQFSQSLLAGNGGFSVNFVGNDIRMAYLGSETGKTNIIFLNSLGQFVTNDLATFVASLGGGSGQTAAQVQAAITGADASGTNAMSATTLGASGTSKLQAAGVDALTVTNATTLKGALTAQGVGADTLTVTNGADLRGTTSAATLNVTNVVFVRLAAEAGKTNIVFIDSAGHLVTNDLATFVASLGSGGSIPNNLVSNYGTASVTVPTAFNMTNSANGTVVRLGVTGASTLTPILGDSPVSLTTIGTTNGSGVGVNIVANYFSAGRGFIGSSGGIFIQSNGVAGVNGYYYMDGLSAIHMGLPSTGDLIKLDGQTGTGTFSGGPVSLIPTNASPVLTVSNYTGALPMGITNTLGGRAQPVVQYYIIDASGGVPVMTCSNETTGVKLTKGKGALASLTETNWFTLPITTTNTIWKIRDESTGSGASVGVITNWLIGL